MFGLFNKSKAFNEATATEFADQMKASNTVVLDVRTRGEFAGGYIKGAKNIDVNDGAFTKKIAGLDKSKNYLVYCRSGMRSASACNYMSDNGFENVTNLRGGIMSWRGPLAQ